MPRPSFHKLVLPTTLQSRQLRIPDNFLRKYGAQLSTVATLTVPGGTIWRLGLKKVDNRICFVDGWQDFIQRYSIGIGYLLVFTYEGNSNFIIHIFGTAELNYQSAMRSRTEGPFHENHHIFEDIEDIDSFDFMDSAPSNPTGALQGKDFTGCMDQLIPAENHILQRHENNDTKKTSRKKRKSRKSDLSAQEASTENDEEAERNRSYESASARVRSNVAYESASARVRGNVANEERERAMNEAAAFAPTNPFCLVVLRPSYLYRGCIMYLPSSFAANLNGVSDFIQLQTSDGEKQWHVRCLDKGGRIKLSQGWYEFTQENGLGEGDICVFELLNTRDVVLQVTFFRLKEDEPSLAAPR